MFKSCGVAVLVLALAACGAPRPRAPLPQGPAIPAVPQAGLPARVYRIDPSQSELRVLVYRAGALARLGHNHVMVNRTVNGTVSLADPVSASTFSWSVQAAEFQVDEAKAREEEGPDFPAEISYDAKAGTLHNMLSAAVLDAADHPSITVKSLAVTRANGGFVATLAIGVAGHESTVDAPFMIDSDSRRLSATGSLDLRQSALGLTPYSLMLGALQVQDTMRVKFRIVAVSSP